MEWGPEAPSRAPPARTRASYSPVSHLHERNPAGPPRDCRVSLSTDGRGTLGRGKHGREGPLLGALALNPAPGFRNDTSRSFRTEVVTAELAT